MTETKREGTILGEISQTTSSDEAIKAKLDAVRAPFYGLNPTNLTDAQVISSETLPESQTNQANSSSRMTPIGSATRLNAQDSGPLNYLVKFRSKRKAA